MRHGDCNLYVQIGFATGVVQALRIGTVVDEGHRKVGSFRVGCIFLDVLLQLIILCCLLDAVSSAYRHLY